MKKTIIAIVIVVLVVVGLYFIINSSSKVVVNTESQNSSAVETAKPATTTPQVNKDQEVIGQSVNGTDIVAYHYGTGANEILFIGGIHGGYEANTVTVAKDLMDYLKANPNVVAATEKVTVIPVLNPDGLAKGEGTVAGRFNGNNVDLNRNFDCDWQTTGVWQSKTVSGGTAAFSEPESQAIQSYVSDHKLSAVVVYFSAAGGVYASNCHTGILPVTSALTNLYAKASGYPANDTFDFYATTGDITNWLSKIGVPAISVLLTNHTDAEWSKNQAGVTAVLKYYSK